MSDVGVPAREGGEELRIELVPGERVVHGLGKRLSQSRSLAVDESLEVCPCTKDFDEVCDDVKEYLSKVPNLYVEDAAVASGRLLETRIRSVTNDPATALAMKNLLVLLCLHAYT